MDKISENRENPQNIYPSILYPSAPEGSKPEPQPSVSLPQLADIAGFSSIAPQLHHALARLASPEENIILTLHDNITRLQEAFIDSLYTTLDSSGIDLEQKLTLALSPTGKLIPISSHSQQEQIINLLEEHPDLAYTFWEISWQSAVLRDIQNLCSIVCHTLDSGPNGLADLAYQISIKGEMNHFYFNKSNIL